MVILGSFITLDLKKINYDDSMCMTKFLKKPFKRCIFLCYKLSLLNDMRNIKTIDIYLQTELL